MADRDDRMHEAEDDMFDENEAEEVVEQNEDAAMDSGDEDGMGDDNGVLEEIMIQNDSVAHFDGHKDSIFCIAQHPTRPELVVTGGGDDTAYMWDATPPEGPLLPQSYETNPQPKERKGQQVISQFEGQDESVNAVCFTLPAGEYVVTGTLAGKLSAYHTPTAPGAAKLVASAKDEMYKFF